VALMLEAKPELTPDQVMQILHDTSEARGKPYHSVNDPKYNKDYGWGIVDAYEAVRKAVGEDYQTVNILSHNMFDEVYNIVTISGTATVTKGNIQAIEDRIDDGAWSLNDGADEWSFLWDTTTVENGLHKVYIRSYDGIEYSNEFELPLKVVNIGAKIITPINESQVQDTVIIKGTSYGENIKEILVKIGDNPWIEAEANENIGNLSEWEYSWDTNSYGNGKYIISVKAYNGNWHSIPYSIELDVKNTKSAGFLNSFDWILILIGMVIIVMTNYFTRKSLK